MEKLVRKFIDQNLGLFLQVDPSNVQFAPGSGVVCLRQAAFKPEVFDGLHLPVALRGGFVEEISVNFSASLFGTGAGAKVIVKNVCLLVGAHRSDWSWEDVYTCKTKLVDLVMKVYALKGAMKKKKQKKEATGTAGQGYFGAVKQRVADAVTKHLMGMLEVHISNVHFRFEDAMTQAVPFACGVKLGLVQVTSSPEGHRLQDRRGGGSRLLMATGDWKHSAETYADPLFRQSVVARRVSTYWDIGVDAGRLLAAKPASGAQVKAYFTRLNLREAFSTCVVEKLLELYPAAHARRKLLPGPRFRERLDFHQYLLFPVSISAHTVANRASEAVLALKAPMKDADVVVQRLDVAVDTEQIRSMNDLIRFCKEFQRKEGLMRSRPADRISKYLDDLKRTRCASSPSSARFTGPDGTQVSLSSAPYIEDTDVAEERRKVVRAWWLHALAGVTLLGHLPRKSILNADALRQKRLLRERFIALCSEVKALEVKLQQQGKSSDAEEFHSAPQVRQLREMQLRLRLPEILEWRLSALGDDGAEEEFDGDAQQTQVQAAALAAPDANKPKSLQISVRLSVFEAHLLIAASHLWTCLLAPHTAAAPGKRVVARQLVAKARISDVCVEAVQKGHSRRVAHWVELRVGGVGAQNCCAKENCAAREILVVEPFEADATSGEDVCIFVGLTTLQSSDGRGDVMPGDIPLGAVLEPWVGLKNHLTQFPAGETPEQLHRLGFLKDYVHEPGRLMTFGFVQAGKVRALDLKPYRRRLTALMKRGTGPGSFGVGNMVRRPSPLALDRELLTKLQKNVQTMVGKSDMLGIFEGAIAGVEAKIVDRYNMKDSLCKDASLAPLQWKVFRNGNPQAMQIKLQKLVRPQEQRHHSLLGAVPRVGDGFLGAGALPWKVSTSLVKQSDFEICWDSPKYAATCYATKSNRGPVMQPRATSGAIHRAPTAPDTSPTELELPLPGTWFRKWCRDGKPRWRYVFFDEATEAIAWKARETDTRLRGAIAMGKMQDICTGPKTPLLKLVRHAQFQSSLVWSVVASERTLDLQAESPAVISLWVAWLRARYKRRFDDRAGAASEAPPGAQRPILRSSAPLSIKARTFPARLRPPQGELCSLQATCLKLHAISSLGKTLQDSTHAVSHEQSSGSGSGCSAAAAAKKESGKAPSPTPPPPNPSSTYASL